MSHKTAIVGFSYKTLMDAFKDNGKQYSFGVFQLDIAKNSKNSTDIIEVAVRPKDKDDALLLENERLLKIVQDEIFREDNSPEGKKKADFLGQMQSKIIELQAKLEKVREYGLDLQNTIAGDALPETQTIVVRSNIIGNKILELLGGDK